MGLNFRATAGAACVSAIFLSLFVGGCRTSAPASNLQRFAFSSPHMGTLFTITLYATNQAIADTAAQEAFARVVELENIMSDYQADSELMRLCDHRFGEAVTVSPDLCEVIRVSLEMSKLSDGAFDITVGPYVRLWRSAKKKKILPTPAQIASAAAAVGWEKVRCDPHACTVTLLSPNMRLDLGGIGKGYAADQAMLALNRHGIRRAVVAASGDIAVGDPPPGQSAWRIGIDSIDKNSNRVRRVLMLHNAGISTSGDSEQFVEINGARYSHIVDPKTGLGLTQRIQATVIGPNATTTDSLDTTVSVLGVKRGLALVDSLPGNTALIMTEQNGTVESFFSQRFNQVPVAP